MEKKTIFEIKALYRDDLRVTGLYFGTGEKAACIVGSIRGNEIQQIYTCSMLVKRLKELELEGRIRQGKQILVVPCVNSYSMNVKKRFWSTDNTDINRMFPGYNLGETTQRIASGVFEEIKDYKHGIQFASFYMPGTFTPHVRMMKTGFESVELAMEFGLPYIVLRNPRPYDTTTLNYNWQIWETYAYSIYTTSTDQIDKKSAVQAVEAVLNYLSVQRIIDYTSHAGCISKVVEDTDMVSVRSRKSGIFECMVKVGEQVRKGELLAEILEPYEGKVLEQIFSPADGMVFFANNEPLAYANTAVFKLVAE